MPRVGCSLDLSAVKTKPASKKKKNKNKSFQKNLYWRYFMGKTELN